MMKIGSTGEEGTSREEGVEEEEREILRV